MTIQLRISAWLGIAFGVFLVFGETLRNWAAWGYWASYAFDYLFALLLILFGRMTLTGARWAHVMLIATWALTVALFTFSFSSHMQRINEATSGPLPQIELTVAIGALDLVAVVAFILAVYSLFATRSKNAAQSNAYNANQIHSRWSSDCFGASLLRSGLNIAFKGIHARTCTCP